MEPNEKDPKHVLHAYDPARGLPPTDAAAEAMEASLADPALRQWWEDEQNFDRQFAAKVQAVPVPAGLAERILAAAAAEAREAPAPAVDAVAPVASPARQNNFWHWSAFAGAAAAVMLAALFFTFVFKAPSPTAFDQTPQLASIVAELEGVLRERSANMQKSNDYATLVSFLAEGGAPSPRQIPHGLAKENSFACANLVIDGIPVGMMCFQADEAVYHIFSINRVDLPEQSDLNAPIFSRINDHSWATWTTEDQVQILGTTASKEKVLTLL